MKPVWTYPPEPTDKGHYYRHMAPILGIGMLYAATATKTVQAAKVNKSLQFIRSLRDFFIELQEIVGDFCKWPSYILKALFCEPLNLLIELHYLLFIMVMGFL